VKTKYLVVATLHICLIIFILLNHDMLVWGIVELYCIAFASSFILANVAYLFMRKKPYVNHIKNEFFKTSIAQIVLLALVIYSTQTRYISKHDALQDLDTLVQTLQDVHQDLYHNTSKASFDSLLDEYKRIMPNDISELDFYRDCSRLTSRFKDGHTRIMNDILDKRMQFAIRAIFPYRIRIIDDRMFVIDNLTLLHRIPPGSEIVAINGKSAVQCISELSQLVSYETIGWRNTLIVDPFTIGIWNGFNSFTIDYRRPGSNDVSQVESSGGMFSKMAIVYRLFSERPKELTFHILPGNIGYIGFYGCNDLSGYKQFYESTFKEIKEKHIQSLIIDIRNNGGGYSVIGAELMQYILHRSFKESDSLAFRVSREIAETGKLDYFLKHEEQVPGKKVSIETNGLYLPRDNPNRFPGSCIMLMNHATFSAGTMVAATFHCYADGMIIGEETGGLTVGFGNAHFFDLPNSRMRVMTSWNWSYLVGGIDNGSGVMPDSTVSNTIDDDVAGRDRVLECAVGIIGKRLSVKDTASFITNPIISGYYADPTIIKDHDTWYVYATRDPWGGADLAVLTTKDFRNWNYETINWPTKQSCTSTTSNQNMVWAPSVVKAKDGKFYMYVSVGSEVWVGVSSQPLGPWENAKPDHSPLIRSTMFPGYHMIDAECFVDDDGQAYLYWGSGLGWVNGRCFAVKLNKDMTTFDGDPKVITPPRYFEAPYMLKRNGMYYLMYSDGKAIDASYKIRYSIGATPFGPWKEGKNSPILSTSPDSSTYGPGHHTVFKENNQYYILYHRIHPQNKEYVLRELCIDSLNFNRDGSIKAIKPMGVSSIINVPSSNGTIP
jgi:hypothetical protein